MRKKLIASVLAVLVLFCGLAPGAAALSYQAESVFVMDAQTGETLYEYNADIARVPASMTKAVSYTHLDVYKRQMSHSAMSTPEIALFSMPPLRQ